MILTPKFPATVPPVSSPFSFPSLDHRSSMVKTLRKWAKAALKLVLFTPWWDILDVAALWRCPCARKFARSTVFLKGMIAAKLLFAFLATSSKRPHSSRIRLKYECLLFSPLIWNESCNAKCSHQQYCPYCICETDLTMLDNEQLDCISFFRTEACVHHR